jgi:hypothetical protein
MVLVKSISTCSVESIAQQRGLVSHVAWCLQTLLLSWCSSKGIDVSCRLVPTNIVVELVLLQGDWCLLQVSACKHCC